MRRKGKRERERERERQKEIKRGRARGAQKRVLCAGITREISRKTDEDSIKANMAAYKQCF